MARGRAPATAGLPPQCSVRRPSRSSPGVCPGIYLTRARLHWKSGVRCSALSPPLLARRFHVARAGYQLTPRPLPSRCHRPGEQSKPQPWLQRQRLRRLATGLLAYSQLVSPLVWLRGGGVCIFSYAHLCESRSFSERKMPRSHQPVLVRLPEPRGDWPRHTQHDETLSALLALLLALPGAIQLFFLVARCDTNGPQTQGNTA